MISNVYVPSLQGDDALVDTAVDYINAQVARVSVELARQVGTYIIDTFFDGNYDNFTNSNARKSVSFRSLCEREDLLLPRSRLYALVRISQQLEHLPESVRNALPLSHQRALLSVRDPTIKGDLARLAVSNGWTKRELEAQVVAVRGPTNRGRKPLPRLAKVIPKLTNVAATMPNDLSDAVAELKEPARQELANELQSVLAELQHVVAALEQPPTRRARTRGIRSQRPSRPH